MRERVVVGCFGALISVLSWMLIVAPVHAFIVSNSATGYVSKIGSAAVATYQSANIASEAATIGAAAYSGGGASMVLRIVAGAGYVGIGVAAGLALLQMYYSASDLAAIKANAATPGSITIPGYSPQANSTLKQIGSCPNASDANCGAGYDQYFLTTISLANWVGCGTAPTGWYSYGAVANNGVVVTCKFIHTGDASTLGSQGASTPATQSQVASYLQGLPSSDPNSIASHQSAVGYGATPLAADNVTTVAADPSQLPQTTVPASQVTTTDIVTNPNATQPAGPAPTQNPSQQSTSSSTSTSTTTTSGSTTTTTTTVTQTDTTPVSACSVGNHDQRTFGGVLQQHMTLWQSSGLLAALNLLKNLTWPNALQTYSLTSSTWGSFTIDFSSYATVLAALRTIIIALASFVAYRIVFVGGR